MITPNRDKVIENIKVAAEAGTFHEKVEVGDPCYTEGEREKVLKRYLSVRQHLPFQIRNWVAGRTLDLITWYWNRNTEIVGLENIKGIKEGAIITSNHFNPSENTAIRLLSQKMKKDSLHIVSQDTNLAMKGLFGFYMNYVDIIPISPNPSYMKNDFEKLMSEAFEKGQNILIYPEQEMWFNYRKPRPPKRGAYYYAAKFGVPVISCFVEMRELKELEKENFHKIKYILHVLPTIYPDLTKSLKECSVEMMEKDYNQKVSAYEDAYGKKLDYKFETWDIAGWIP